MSIFRVGQRVRCLNVDGTRSPYQGVIWRIGFDPATDDGGWQPQPLQDRAVDPHETPHLIDIDGIGRCDEKHWFALPARLLEPIAPPPELATWDTCPWQPKVKVSA